MDEFFDLVAKIWRNENKGHSALERWQNKILSLRQYMRGWAKTYDGCI